MNETQYFSFLLWNFLDRLLCDGYLGISPGDAGVEKEAILFVEIVRFLKANGLKLDLAVNSFKDMGLGELHREVGKQLIELAKDFDDDDDSVEHFH
jgi:hypothetical protein